MVASGAKLFPTSCPVYFGLTALYKAAGGANINPVLTGWMNDCDPCDSSCPQGGTWQGLTCENVPTPAGVQTVVTRVMLQNKKLAGYLPSQVRLCHAGHLSVRNQNSASLYSTLLRFTVLHRAPPPGHIRSAALVMPLD